MTGSGIEAGDKGAARERAASVRSCEKHLPRRVGVWAKTASAAGLVVEKSLLWRRGVACPLRLAMKSVAVVFAV